MDWMYTDYDVGYTRVQNAAQLVPLYDNVYDCHESANTDHIYEEIPLDTFMPRNKIKVKECPAYGQCKI